MKIWTIPMVLLTLGCTSSVGEDCNIDSDCEGGLICSASGTCETESSVNASLQPSGDASVSKDTASSPDGAGQDTTGGTAAPVHPCGDQPYTRRVLSCSPEQGLFSAKTGTCPDVPGRFRVISITMAQEGGVAGLAPVANPFIESNIGGDDPSIILELWRDGSFALNCPGSFAWWTEESDINDDCTPKYTGTFPLKLPLGPEAIALVENSTFDLTTGALTGVVDKNQLIPTIPESFQPTADMLITHDVDTDGDGEPDRASVKLTVCFE